MLDPTTIVGVVGAGAMGRGIAQVAATAGHTVLLADARPGAASDARATISGALAGLVSKGKLDASARDAILDRIIAVVSSAAERGTREPPTTLVDVGALARCGLIIEAIVEDLPAKRELFSRLAATVADDAVLATNTSSLSVAAIAAGSPASARVIGLHFFNPPPLMPLVEVVPWAGTNPEVRDACLALMGKWKKTAVVCSDTPGFIVNRVARPFYGEALRIAEEGTADYATIDWAMRTIGGFRMGPFELMDFIGNDVNFAVTRSIYEGFFLEPRYRPSLTQQALVASGFLGRKSGRGYYDYRDGAATPEARRDEAAGAAIVARIRAMLINEAVDALRLGVASAADIDTAMVSGVNYPKGLLAWCDELGAGAVLATIERLHAEYGEERYRPSPLLRQAARDKRSFRS
ncbi:MAG: 3-hydroxyacyl-CoA dehydrogenase NAD-binding domain-containing protein [Gemmatimonadaceae bacterium]|jgi:3-hydroxybutyryl-CoA dehydrogenase